MSQEMTKRPPDPFGDDEGILDIDVRPVRRDEFQQIAALAVGLLDRVFGPIVGKLGEQAIEVVRSALNVRLRNDCTWVMTEGDTVIGMVDLETQETRKLNGPPLPRILADSIGVADKVRQAGLLSLLEHEPDLDEAHQALVALLPGSRGEGRGTVLLMHGAFWARAQGKNWITTWLPSDDPFFAVYERRGFFIEREVGPEGRKWLCLKKPITSAAHKIMRQKNREIDGG
jgi:GNAT superfamily N-acetyltransferase